jgi:AcrR family transcriptional regulator
VAREKDREKPSQIIEAAFAVFGETGYRAAGIKDIADRAGIAPGTIYTYFHDKHELFRATAEQLWERFLGQVRTLAAAPETAERRLERFLELGFGSLRQYLPLLRGMLFESSQMNILQKGIDELCRLVESVLMERPVAARRARVDQAARRSAVRMVVMGALFSAALAEPAEVDGQIDGLRRTMTWLLAGD